MKPIYKWTGGKRKEIPIFRKYIPTHNLYVEPFFGGGALFWELEPKNAIINDIDSDLTIFLNVVKHNFDELNKLIVKLSQSIDKISSKEKEGLIDLKTAKKLRGEFYYDLRKLDRNDDYHSLSDLERAFRFYVVNQLAFNGMRRFNSKGQFNVPYGNYKRLPLNLTNEHQNLLVNTTINNTTYKNLNIPDNEDTFIFLDPPYTRVFNEYSADNVFGLEQQNELYEWFKSFNHAKIMLIINKDKFTAELYGENIKEEYNLKYSTNIKNRFNNEVKHIIVTNY